MNEKNQKSALPNIDPETGIAYGVIKGNSVMELVDEIQTHGDSINREAAVEEIRKALDGALDDVPIPSHRKHEVVDRLVQEVMEEAEFEFDEESFTYETNDGYKYILGYLGGAILIWCTKSPHVTWARHCSPCVPNAGDLDNPSADRNGTLCYCPHIECIEDEIRDQMTIVDAADQTKIVRARQIPNEE